MCLVQNLRTYLHPFQALRRLRRLCSEDSYTPSLSPLRDASDRSPETEAALAKPARYVSPFANGLRVAVRPVTAEDVRAQQQASPAPDSVAGANNAHAQKVRGRSSALPAHHFALGPTVSLPHTPEDGDDRFAITRKSRQHQRRTDQTASVYELLARLGGETYI